MRRSRFGTTALLSWLGSACGHVGPAAAQPVEPPRGIEVTGRGTFEAAPDQATFRIGVETTASTVEAAREDAARAMTRMMDALSQRGVPEADRRTTALSLQAEYDYANRERKLRGYVARHDLVVKVTELPSLSPIVDATVAAGGDATRLHGVSFELSDRAAAESEARSRAMAQARRRAEELARAAGVELGPVELVREGSFGEGPSPPPGPMMMRAAEATPTPVAPGEIVVTVDVAVRYAIRE